MNLSKALHHVTGCSNVPTYVVLLMVLMVFPSGCAENETPPFDESAPVVEVLRLDAKKGNPRNSEGDFIALNSGRILFAYTHFVGNNSEDDGAAFIAGRFSDDDGRHWSKNDHMLVPREGIMNVMSVSFLRLQSGKIAMFYLRKNSYEDCIPMMRMSADEGVTWSAPVPCITDRDGYFVLNNDRVIQLESGRLLMAVSLHQMPGEHLFSYVGRLYTYYSDDEGMTWYAGAEVPNPDWVVTQEPGVIELTNGQVLMFSRTTAGVQYFSLSDDGGQSWAPVRPGNLRSPLSPASIERIPATGDLLAVWNSNGLDQRRTPLNIAISQDEGRTWTNKRTIETDPEGSYCYTAIHFLEKDILLAYLDLSTNGIKVRRVKLEWLYENL